MAKALVSARMAPRLVVILVLLAGALGLVRLTSRDDVRRQFHAWRTKGVVTSCLTRSHCGVPESGGNLAMGHPPFPSTSRCGRRENVEITNLSVSQSGLASVTAVCRGETGSAVFHYLSPSLWSGAAVDWTRCEEASCREELERSQM
ncbi:MAG: hypothetical protein V4597_02235 [Pseudomonadota bacterium]